MSRFTLVNSPVINIKSLNKKQNFTYLTLKQYCHCEFISSQKTLKQVAENSLLKVVHIEYVIPSSYLGCIECIRSYRILHMALQDLNVKSYQAPV